MGLTEASKIVLWANIDLLFLNLIKWVGIKKIKIARFCRDM